MKNVILSLLVPLLLLTACKRGEKIKAHTQDSATATNAVAATSPAPPAPPALPAEPAPPSTPAPTTPSNDEVAVLKTSEGEMVIAFWPDVAPATVENFKKLARAGFYDGTAFHRIIKGFMIQGGDPLTKDPSAADRYGTGDPGYKINAEFNPRQHLRGVISMARGGDPNSAGSQFFICLAARPDLDNNYTTFGQLIKGDDVLERIGNTPVGANAGGEPSVPQKRVELQSVKLMPLAQIMNPAN